MTASVAIFHQRFSTNTMPQWRLAHPFRFLAHNGEINTVEGNRSWAYARGPILKSPLLPDLSEVLPLVSMHGSDSQSLDNMLEVLLMGGLDVMHAMRLLIPPAWQSVDAIDPDLRAFYEFNVSHMEPWDGPAGVVLTDGRYAACTLDRNGLRPARWVITDNRHLTDRLRNGCVGLQAGAGRQEGQARSRRDDCARPHERRDLLDTRRIDDLLKSRYPYKQWLKQGVRYLESGPDRPGAGRRADGSRDARDLPEDVQHHGRGARRDHPRAGARTRARPWAPWATTRRCRCCRTRSARSTTTSGSSSRR